MGRPKLAGGYVRLEVGVGADLLDLIDELRDAEGWSRAEFMRRAAAALVAAIKRTRGARPAPVAAVPEVFPVDESEAEDDVDDPAVPAPSGTTGALVPRGGAWLGGGRWGGWWPQDATDEQIVASLRAAVPGGTAYLRRPKHPDALVHAWADPADEVERLRRTGWAPSPFYREFGPDYAFPRVQEASGS